MNSSKLIMTLGTKIISGSAVFEVPFDGIVGFLEFHISNLILDMFSRTTYRNKPFVVRRIGERGISIITISVSQRSHIFRTRHEISAPIPFANEDIGYSLYGGDMRRLEVFAHFLRVPVDITRIRRLVFLVMGRDAALT